MTDDEVSERIRKECHGWHDEEANGCKLDVIISQLLRHVGYSKTADAFDNAPVWRA